MKKFTALFLVFSLMMLSISLYAKERRGAKLLITKKDGQNVLSELITVKENSLLLLNLEGKDVSVDIADIKVIRVVKKSKFKFWTMAVIGGGIGVSIGIGIGVAKGLASDDEIMTPGVSAVSWGVIYGSIGGIAGALLGALIWIITITDTNKNKPIQIEGMTDLEIQETMDYLRKKARIRDYK